MKKIILLLMIPLFSETIIDSWLDEKLILLNQFPIKIEGDLFIQNEFSEQKSAFEINIKNKDNFWVDTGSKQIYYSYEWTKIFDSYTNQLIIEIPDTNLIKHFSNIFINKTVDINYDCSSEKEVRCKVRIPQFNIFFDAIFNPMDSALISIIHYFKNTTATVKNIEVITLIDNQETYWNPEFEDSFIIDLRP